ncbi:hypothetical protein [Deinococcus sp.]|uniref:hypothetical protein n=1 Tax=Deinococcus sp. TaxID=47478 RepID=UPI003B5BACD4
MTRLKPRPAQPVKTPQLQSERQVRPPLRHMELSLADIERILDPRSTPEQAARREKTLARARWLGEQRERQSGNSLHIDLDEFRRV